MRLSALCREAVLSAWAARIPSVLVALVAGLACAIAGLTAGQSAASVREISAQLESPSARQLVVRDVASGGFINQRTVTAVAALSTVEQTVALGVPVDASNVLLRGGPPVTVWPVHAGLLDAVRLVQGRRPAPGEVIVSVHAMDRLRLTVPLGAVVSRQRSYPIVGSFEARPPFEELDAGALLMAPAGEDARELRTVITRAVAAPVTQSAILEVLDPPNADAIALESPVSRARTAVDVQRQVTAYGRSVLLLILAAGAALIAVVVLADTLIHRRDLGRRRTLGITRLDLVLLVQARTVVAALAGIVVGSATAAALSLARGQPLVASFPFAVGVLAVLVTVLAATGPAIHAAWRDPVRIMRTP